MAGGSSIDVALDLPATGDTELGIGKRDAAYSFNVMAKTKQIVGWLITGLAVFATLAIPTIAVFVRDALMRGFAKRERLIRGIASSLQIVAGLALMGIAANKVLLGG